MPTIKDIAKAAGVAHGTVSNVLNKTGKVSTEKIRLVEEAAKRLGYVPNEQAKKLRKGDSKLIAVVVPSLREEACLDLYSALQYPLHSAGFETTIYTTDDIPANEKLLLQQLSVSSLAALIIISCLHGEDALLFNDIPCPVVFVNRTTRVHCKDSTFAAFDFYAAGFVLGEYAVKRGWQSLAFFSSPSYLSDDTEVFTGLSDALANTSVAVQKFTSDTNLGINKAFDISHSSQTFDAIITTQPQRSEMMATALRFSGRHIVPQLISLSSYKAFSSPFYTPFELDYCRMGTIVSQLVLKRLQAQEAFPGHTVLACKGFPFSSPALVHKSGRELRMLTLQAPSSSALEKIAPLFESQSGIKLQITSLPYKELYEQVQQHGDNGLYDLIRIDVAWLDTLGAKIYQPLEHLGIHSSTLPQNLIIPALRNYSMVNNVLYTLPFDPSVQILLYRKDLFEDATLRRSYYEQYRQPLNVPQTIEEFLQAAEFFTKSKNPLSPTEYGTTATCGNPLTAASDILPFFLAEGGSLCSEAGEVCFNSPAMVRSIEKYTRMFQFTSGSKTSWWQDSVNLFAEGKTATTNTFSNHAAYIINTKRSHVVGKIGGAVLPGAHPLLGGGVLGVSAHTKKYEECRDFFNWYYTTDVASAIVRLGGTSPLTEAYQNFENFTIFPWLEATNQSFAVGVRGLSEKQAKPFSILQYEYALGCAVHHVIEATMSIEDALEAAQKLYVTQVKNPLLF